AVLTYKVLRRRFAIRPSVRIQRYHAVSVVSRSRIHDTRTNARGIVLPRQFICQSNETNCQVVEFFRNGILFGVHKRRAPPNDGKLSDRRKPVRWSVQLGRLLSFNCIGGCEDAHILGSSVRQSNVSGNVVKSLAAELFERSLTD